MDFITLNLLGLDDALWGDVPTPERNKFNLICMILCGLIIFGLVGMLFIGYAVMESWTLAAFIGIFFNFLFFNIYRFALVSLDAVLGRSENDLVSDEIQRIDNKRETPKTIQNTQFKINEFGEIVSEEYFFNQLMGKAVQILPNFTGVFPKLNSFFEFSFIVRTIIISLLGFIVCFGWNLAINWQAVTEFNQSLSSAYSDIAHEKSGIYLAQTAIFISKKPGFILWLFVVIGFLLYGLRLKKQLVSNPKYMYIQSSKNKNEKVIAEDYSSLSSRAMVFFKENQIKYQFDSKWKNPPYRTELNDEFIQKVDVGIEILTKGK